MLESVLMVAEVVIAILLLIVILLQRSDGGMGALGGAGGGAAFGSSSGGNTLARMTAILAILFVGISLVLAVQNGGKSRPQSVVEGTATVPAVAAEKAATEVEKLQEMEVPVVPATLPVSKEMEKTTENAK